MDREGVSRFPGAEGRIPNFAGAKLAAEQARRPPHLEARPGDQGEPRLAADPRPPARARGGQDAGHGGAAAARPAPVPAARPAKLSAEQIREAATIKGALRHGRVVADDELPEIDLVLCGSVAVNLKGARIGKGGGFSDIEYGLLIEAGKIDDHTVVATTVHPIQILRENLRDRPRPAGRPDRDPARGDRGRARLRAPARDPLGPPAAAADPRDPDPRADGLRVSANPTQTSPARRRPRFEPFGPKPPPTPAEGPDPYGNPDPEWLRIDWREHLHEHRRRRDAGSTTPRWGRRRQSSIRWRSSSSTGSRAAGRTGSRTSPTSPAATA